MESDVRELVCDPNCLVMPEAGCGAFGLALECRVVYIGDDDDVMPAPAPATETVALVEPI